VCSSFELGDQTIFFDVVILSAINRNLHSEEDLDAISIRQSSLWPPCNYCLVANVVTHLRARFDDGARQVIEEISDKLAEFHVAKLLCEFSRSTHVEKHKNALFRFRSVIVASDPMPKGTGSKFAKDSPDTSDDQCLQIKVYERGPKHPWASLKELEHLATVFDGDRDESKSHDEDKGVGNGSEDQCDSERWELDFWHDAADEIDEKGEA